MILSIMNVNTISAACTQEEIDSFKKVEKKYTVKYEFDKTSKKYTMYFNNPNPDNYVYQIYSEVTIDCTVLGNGQTKCINFPSGSYDVDIKGNTASCKDVLKTITINLPEYNKFSDDPLCEGIEEFVLCSPTYEKEIDYESFVSRVKTYKKTKTQKEAQTNSNEDDGEKSNSSIFDSKLVNYIKENWIEITIIMVFIILVTITVVITAKSIRKSRRLE